MVSLGVHVWDGVRSTTTVCRVAQTWSHIFLRLGVLDLRDLARFGDLEDLARFGDLDAVLARLGVLARFGDLDAVLARFGDLDFLAGVLFFAPGPFWAGFHVFTPRLSGVATYMVLSFPILRVPDGHVLAGMAGEARKTYFLRLEGEHDLVIIMLIGLYHFLKI